jgi:hypothetical protein
MYKFFASLIFLCLIPAAHALDVTINAKSDGTAKPTIHGSTNLPDDTVLMISIDRTANSYNAQGKVKVKNKKFISSEFSDRGKDLAPGIYSLDITMPISNVQDQSVRDIIGQDGENIKGKYVKKSMFGGNIIEYKTTIKIGTGKSDRKRDMAGRKDAQEDRKDWLINSCQLTCQSEYPISKYPSAHDICLKNCVKAALR